MENRLKYGFAFKKKYGQNFLSDKNLLSAIVRDAGVERGTNVLEIGTGAGDLTRALCERAKFVLSYEIDKTLKPIIEESLSSYRNVEVVFQDFSKEDLKEIEKKLGKYRVVANLPYYLTTPLLMRFVEESESCEGLCVMVQEEVAERMCAKSGTPEYGALTSAIARRGEAKIVRKVPRELFFPQPQVDSAVVTVDFSGGFEVKSPACFRAAVRCAFQNRRKTLENNLMGSFSLTREQAKELLRLAEIPEGVRGEVLTPQEIGKLSDLIFIRNLP